MKRFGGISAFVLALGLAHQASAADGSLLDPAVTPPATSAPASENWYYRAPPAKVNPPTIAQQKSAVRAQQRMARLEAMRWYGFSASRPQATAMAFTSMYSPAWQMPGGRPFAWYSGSRPVVIFNHSESFYR